MKKRFSFSFQQKVIIGLLLLMSIPFFLTGYLAKNLSENTILQEKEEKLLAFTRILDSRLDPGGYDALLRQHGAENATREEKIRALCRALSPDADEVGMAAPELGTGYYSLELDAILAYGPSSLFGEAVGRSIPATHPGRVVMQTSKELVKSGTMVRGDILNAMRPLVRDGKVIGYAWANELTTNISEQFKAMTRAIFLVMLLCFGLTVCLLLLLARRTMRDVGRIITGVREMRFDLNRRIENSGGELGEVAKSINTMAEDISKANEETRRAISVLRSVINNVDAAVYVCDPQTKRLVYANDYLRKLIGRDDLQGSLCHEVLQNSPEPCDFCPQKKLFDKDGKPIFTPLRWELHNKVINRDFLVTDRLVTWHDGRLLHMEVATDVTDRRALALAEAANLAQRDFLARMSHEIRTPMNGVLGMTHLAMQADPPPAQLEYLKKIQSSASLLLGIINDILDFSRIEAGKLSLEKRAFSLREMVENIRELIAPRAKEKGLDFTINQDESVPERAAGDGLRLSQVLLNLLGNATKFTPAGYVRLDMSARLRPSGALRLTCTIRDSGIGLSAEEQAGLFQPFSQADSSISRKFGGTGLGLSISKALVELMGGAISVRSEPDKGSEFSFFVDLEPVDEPREAEEEKEQPGADIRHDGLAFLLVEDNAINQEIAQAVLSALGADVDVADNGEEGLRAFLRKDYALILMDVRMPVMDGLEATRRIRSSGKHDAGTVPIIAMTAKAMREDREASHAAGMDGHIAKPIDVDELKTALFKQLKEGREPQ